MGEKHKWFDRREEPLPPVTPLRVVTQLTPAAVAGFLIALADAAVPPDHRAFWQQLAVLAPLPRLIRNSKVVLELLPATSDQLFTERERQYLGQLAKRNVPAVHQATAQALLNVYERDQLRQSCGLLFHHARRQPWPETLHELLHA